MVIVGITGTLSAGKESIVQYLQLVHGFHIINLENKEWEDKIQSKPYSGENYESEEDFRQAVARQALRIIMEDWQEHYIVYPITLPHELEVFQKRSYFILLGIDAPTKLRYTYYCKKHGKPKNLLQGFLHMDDHVITN